MKLVLRLKDGKKARVSEDGYTEGLAVDFAKEIWKPFGWTSSYLDNGAVESVPGKEIKPGDPDFLMRLGFKLRKEYAEIDDFWLEDSSSSH